MDDTRWAAHLENTMGETAELVTVSIFVPVRVDMVPVWKTAFSCSNIQTQ